MNSRSPTLFLNASQLRKVDKQVRYIIFGYVRLQQVTIKLSNIIPELIPLIILAFNYNYQMIIK